MAQLTKPLTSDDLPFNSIQRDGDHDAVKIRIGVIVPAGDPVVINHLLGRVPTEVIMVRKDKDIRHYETFADKQKVVLAFTATDADVTMRIA